MLTRLHLFDPFPVEREAQPRPIGHAQAPIDHFNTLLVKFLEPVHVLDKVTVGDGAQYRETMLCQDVVGYRNAVGSRKRRHLPHLGNAANALEVHHPEGMLAARASTTPDGVTLRMRPY